MVLVTGATGFVGGKIMQLCEDVIACPSLRDVSEEDVVRLVGESGVDTIIHTAAISDIGVCQANPEASYRANVQIPLYLAKAARGIKLICFSSDQVYSGMKDDGPYAEDTVKPNNIYAQHKWEMEQRVLEICPDAVMLRAEWMYDYYLKKPNYFMNILNATERVAFSSKQYRGITYVKEVAQNMQAVMRLPGGIYNFGSETDKSMYEITRDFLDMIGKDIEVEEALPAHNLWMNCEKAARHGVVFSRVEEALKQCAADYPQAVRTHIGK